MNRRSFLLTSLISLLFISGLYLTHVYMINTDDILWFEENIVDGNYTIIGYEEKTFFSIFGTKTSIYITNHNDSKGSNWFTTKVNNRGKPLSNKNYQLEYTEEYVKITLLNYKGEISSSLRLHYKDFKSVKERYLE